VADVLSNQEVQQIGRESFFGAALAHLWMSMADAEKVYMKTRTASTAGATST